MGPIFFVAACMALCFGCFNQTGSVTAAVFLSLLNNTCSFPTLSPLLRRLGMNKKLGGDAFFHKWININLHLKIGFSEINS